MPRNVVVCCDGTANEFSPDRTNVVKLYYALEHDRADQLAFYHPGLGTMEPAGALSPPTRRFTRILGQAVAYGLSADIRDAYTYLVNNLKDDDDLYIFGFSRGAYTARAVCSLLKMYGLIRPGNDPLVPYAIRMMMAVGTIREAQSNKLSISPQENKALKDYFKLADDFRNSMSRTACRPHFVGVWDTVSSVGWKNRPVKLPFTADNPDINIGRHAIAIDEKRAFFRPNRWIPSNDSQEHGPKDLKQVWFAGMHSDVGGGYPEEESGLSKFALEWMLEEAKKAGLKVNAARQEEVLGRSAGSTYAPADPDAMMHESLEGWWKLAEWIRKPHYDYRTGKTEMLRNRGKRRTIPSRSLVHESVYRRENGAYAKRVLPADAIPTV